MIFTTELQPRTTLPSQEPAEPTLAVEKSSETFSNSTALSGSKIIIRTEEVVIVTLVLVLWIAAIALFFNRWGKIRMLEPYQPKFIQQHRPSCPLVDPVQHRSFSRFNISSDTCKAHLRPRQNSVFVGSSIVSYPVNPPRRVKSAFDLKTLILSDPVLNRSIIRLNLAEDLGGASLRAALSVHPEPQPSSPVGRAEISFGDSSDAEVPHFEFAQCCIERESNADGDPNGKSMKVEEQRSNLPASNRSSGSESANQDVRLNLPSGSDRRCSLRPLQKENGDGGEQKTPRRNSVMFINLMENDRASANARGETIKSGIIDFRRNSMLIINNLNEEVGIRPFSRNMSLGNSNVALGDFPCIRRGSVIATYSQEHKAKVPMPQVSIMKSKLAKNSSLARQETEGKFLSCQKSSKSLDSGESARSPHMWRHGRKASSPIPDVKRQFLTPATVHVGVGSTASLNAEPHKPEERKPMDESRSTGNLAQAEFLGPRIIESRCTSENVVAETAVPNNGRVEPRRTKPQRSEVFEVRKSSGSAAVNLTTSLSSINVTSSIPLNVITSSGTNSETNPVEISHV